MERSRLDEILTSARLELPGGAEVEITGADPVLPAKFPVGEAAATALALCGATAAHLWELRTGRSQRVRVDDRFDSPGCSRPPV